MANIDIDSLPSQSPLVDTDKVAGSNAAGTSSKWLASTLWTYILSKLTAPATAAFGTGAGEVAEGNHGHSTLWYVDQNASGNDDGT